MILSKAEKTTLKAIADYPYADIDDRELHGFLHFPSWEVTLGALGGLRRKGLIEQRERPRHGYKLTEAGEQYILRKKHRRRGTALKLAIGFLSGVASTVVATILTQ